MKNVLIASANNDGSDETARMCRHIRAFTVGIHNIIILAALDSCACALEGRHLTRNTKVTNSVDRWIFDDNFRQFSIKAYVVGNIP